MVTSFQIQINIGFWSNSDNNKLFRPFFLSYASADKNIFEPASANSRQSDMSRRLAKSPLVITLNPNHSPVVHSLLVPRGVCGHDGI